MLSTKRSLAGFGTIAFALVLFLSQASPLPACSTIVVGKKISPTGRVLLGHNEDNEGRLLMARYLVPGGKHQAGALLTFEDGRASIPQVAETAGLMWSETLASWKAAFSDSYVNEWGVAAVSNSCEPSREDQADLTQGGIGYALLRLAAERARTARQAVAVAARLIDEYGYGDSGRTYVFADKDEGWFLEVVKGRHYAAERVPDDEVAFIPNHYTIRSVDAADPRDFLLSPDLIGYAARRGWYKPVQADSTADFDFKRAYGSGLHFDARWQPTRSLDKDNNILRHKRALEMLTGKSWGYADEFPFAVAPGRPVGVEDIKAILRSHHEGTADYLSTSPAGTPHSNATICASETQESLVIDFRSDPRFTVVLRTMGRPCTNPYVPWYLGIRKTPDDGAARDPETALREHFRPTAEDLSHDPAKAWWNALDLENILEPRYLQGDAVPDLARDIQAFEAENLAGMGPVESKAKALLAKDPAGAMDVLTRYTNARAQAARDLARKTFDKLDTVKIKLQAPELRRDARGAIVLVAVLSDAGFDAGQVDPATVRFGPGFVQMDRWIKGSGLLQDFNQDGRLDLVMAFPAADLLALLVPCRQDVWLTGRTRQGRVIVAREFLTILE